MKRVLAIAFLAGALASSLLRLAEANARAERAEAWAEAVGEEAGMILAARAAEEKQGE